MIDQMDRNLDHINCIIMIILKKNLKFSKFSKNSIFLKTSRFSFKIFKNLEILIFFQICCVFHTMLSLDKSRSSNRKSLITMRMRCLCAQAKYTLQSLVFYLLSDGYNYIIIYNYIIYNSTGHTAYK